MDFKKILHFLKVCAYLTAIKDVVKRKMHKVSYVKTIFVMMTLALVSSVGIFVYNAIDTPTIEQTKVETNQSDETTKLNTFKGDWVRQVSISILFVVAIIILILTFYENKSDFKKIIAEPPIQTLIVFVAINAILGFISPQMWINFWNSGYFFFSACGIIILSGLKKYMNLSWFRIAIIAIVVFLFSWISERIKSPSHAPQIVLTPTFKPDLPAEIGLPIIAECESGGNHFEKDGAVRMNREGSTATGRYQILASKHEQRAKSMGFDIKTPEGNEGYAKVLYDESGFKHWLVDSRARECIEKAFAGNFDPAHGKTVWRVKVEAPIGSALEYSLESESIRGYKYYYNADDLSKNYQVEFVTEEGVEKHSFPSDEYLVLKSPTRALRFKSLEKEPVLIHLTFTKQD